MSDPKKPAAAQSSLVSVPSADLTLVLERTLGGVREDLRDNPYIVEAIKVLSVGGYRSAIGSFWNAVVDDLRNKINHRGLALFNKTMSLAQGIKSYEDFQNLVNDDQLIEGAYKIGVIGWEASKVLRHAKETRHIFDGHPKSSDPSPLKVLALMEDCIKYVLNEPFPTPIIDIDQYVSLLGEASFDRNEIAVDNAMGDLPELYQVELANRVFTIYAAEGASSVIRSNIEFVSPILWRVLSKEVRIQVVRRVDQVIAKGNAVATGQAFSFVQVVGALSYLSANARRYRIEPLVKSLSKNLDDWSKENELVRELAPFAAIIPADLVSEYVGSLTKTYVGYTGSSGQFSRTDFFANGAALVIPSMFEAFDDRAAEVFVETVRTDTLLRGRIDRPPKLKRLRALGHRVLGRVSEKFAEKPFLMKLVDETKEGEFWAELGKGKKPE